LRFFASRKAQVRARGVILELNLHRRCALRALGCDAWRGVALRCGAFFGY
jgi:hypothetical protein